MNGGRTNICVQRHVRLGRFISPETRHGYEARPGALELFYYLVSRAHVDAGKTRRIYGPRENDTVAHVVRWLFFFARHALITYALPRALFPPFFGLNDIASQSINAGTKERTAR